MKKTKGNRISYVRSLCPKRHILLLCALVVTGAYFALRQNREVMNTWYQGVVRPYQGAVGQFCAKLSFSVTELLGAVAVLLILVYIIVQLARLILWPEKLRRVYIMFVTLLSAAAAAYALLCLTWGAGFYADGFLESTELEQRTVSADELETVTRYFAEQANYYSELVGRDADGVFSCSEEELFAASETIYGNIEKEFPYLKSVYITPKSLVLSRLMSYTNYTGVTFPLTGESSINTDTPQYTHGATIAHEMAHQRGVTPEQEANFVAVLACMSSDDVSYRYSGAMLAYSYLSRALYSADHDAWEEITAGLSDGVRADFAANSEYWSQFDTIFDDIFSGSYDKLLTAYGQSGNRSYGECVDLLVAYYA